MRRKLRKVGSVSLRQGGVALLEILVGLAILGVIAVAFIDGMTTTFKAIDVSKERVAAESLAKSQVEYIKVQDYILVDDYNPAYPATSYDLITVPPDLAAAGYSVNITVPEVVISEIEGGFELQSINVTVNRNNERKMQISIYRVSG
jgi:type II secretory pathway pseudopilin PulG